MLRIFQSSRFKQ